MSHIRINQPEAETLFSEERDLLAAVLERAVRDAVCGDPKIKKEALRWIYCENIFQRKNDTRYLFEDICDHIGFDPQAMRKGIAQIATFVDNHRNQIGDTEIMELPYLRGIFGRMRL